MAKYTFKCPRAELELGGAVYYAEVNADTLELLRTCAESVRDAARRLGSGGDCGEVADAAMDAVSQLLGDGAGETIMAAKPDHDVFDVLDVFAFICREILNVWKTRLSQLTGGEDGGVPAHSSAR